MTTALLSPPRVGFTPSPQCATPAIRNRRRAARAAIGSGLVVFVLATLGLSIALETTHPEWREPEFGHRLALLRKQARPVVLVIGTSRTQNAIAPDTMSFPNEAGSPRVMNFGQSAATPLKELLTLHRVLDEGVKPAAVVVELFPPALAVNGTDEAELRDRALRLSANDIEHLAPLCERPSELWHRWLLARAVPWHAHRQVLMNHWGTRWQPANERIDFQWTSLDANGFQATSEVSAERRELLTAVARREWADGFIGFHPGASSVRAVRELVAVCRARAIPVAFFVPPISPGFRAAFSPGVLATAESYLQSLCDELGVPVFPTTLDVTEDEFMDGHHMLKHGAERYSRWLADTHIKPWLAQSRRNGP
ncbi:MAG: hypothetical protein C0467_28500 [Planctomycetaceae bacterium]|nr:hypothetical protein [Planctomycetaceae bacterium]